MSRIDPADVLDLVQYEKARDRMRAEVIALKAVRRVALGPNLTLLFENRQTVLFQVQEMIRTERIVDPARIQEELDAYAPLLPGQGELSATLFIEIPGLASMTNEQVRAAVNRFQGLDREAVRLQAGDVSVPARFEGGHSKEEKMAAVQYLRFPVSVEGRAALADPARPLGLVADHPDYQAQATISPELREQLLADLAE